MPVGDTDKTPDRSFRVSKKSGKGAFSVVTLRVATLNLPLPSFFRSIENLSAVTFVSAARKRKSKKKRKKIGIAA